MFALSFFTFLKMCTLCAISRDDDESAKMLKDYAETVLVNGSVLVFDIEPIEVSSSEIRENLKNGRSCKGLISEKTSEYIKENKLYGQ